MEPSVKPVVANFMKIAPDTIELANAMIAHHGCKAAELADCNVRSLRSDGNPMAALAWTHIAYVVRNLLRGRPLPT